ncbi:inositol monophosphatase family protein [Streptomyces sp. 4N509B]|uniref:inositol monophosphatase family protein n=1 Tax=Streptomyces sp. 4N509B TaxID=3457413 RepID=UPI003FD3A3A7
MVSLDGALADRVAATVREAAAEEVMRRWKKLAAHEVTRKQGLLGPVSAADLAAERRLTRELTALLPGSRVVGEEAVHTDPAGYEALRGASPVWIIDPIDGTRPYVGGEPGFATLVALAQHGEILGAWIDAPALGLAAHARRGGGAWLNGERLLPGPPAPGAPLRVACSHPDYVSPPHQRALRALWTDGVAPRVTGAAGLEYLRIARGELDAVAYSWELAWDHAAGLLLVAEAGGTSLTLDDEPFRLAGGNALPFTAARDPDTARRILGVLRSARPSSRQRPVPGRPSGGRRDR